MNRKYKNIIVYNGRPDPIKSIKEYDLVYALNLRKGLIRELAGFKIDSVEKYNEIQQKMLKSGYSESKSAREVIAYLGDLKEARKKGIDILKQRDQRLDNIRKNREAKAAQREPPASPAAG